LDATPLLEYTQSMSTTTKLMTADELWRLPKVDKLYELVQGELIIMSPAGFDHGEISQNILFLLQVHVRKNGLGSIVGPDTGFVLSRDPDTVRSPDGAFIRKERTLTPRPVKYWDGVPDLAVEVLSPSDSATEMDAKVQEYLDAGATEVIVITPKMKMVKIFRHGHTATVLRSGDILRDLESVPGFQCQVDEIFA
jgi:Uma2 family endonuclease